MGWLVFTLFFISGANTAHFQYKENFMTWGAEAYLIKSSNLTELKQKIREVLEKRKKPTKS